MRNAAESGHVKGDDLIRLDSIRYRVDTIWHQCARFYRARAFQAPSMRFSSAKSDATLSRARTSIARPRSTRTSGGRGREL
jgi:hypothetical protein